MPAMRGAAAANASHTATQHNPASVIIGHQVWVGIRCMHVAGTLLLAKHAAHHVVDLLLCEVGAGRLGGPHLAGELPGGGGKGWVEGEAVWTCQCSI